MKREQVEEYELARPRVEPPNSWEVIMRGTKEQCQRHLEANTRFWYDGEKVVLFKVTRSYTPIVAWTGEVKFHKEEL